MFSIQSISKEVHGRAARRVKTYGIPVKLRILPPDVRSENGPFRPDTSGIRDFVYQRAEGELINRIFNATSA